MRPRSQPWLVGLFLLGLLLWCYWTTLVEMSERWFDDPQYSHGYFVPLFSIYLLWSRSAFLKDRPLSPSWWGIVVLVAGLGLRFLGSYYFYGYFDAISLLACLIGLSLTTGGRPVLSWSWPAILFLGFMVPLPYRLQNALGGTLQQIATQMSTYLLQTCGVPAVAEGNIILINDLRPIGVVEACSGLGMLVTFVAISTAIAIVLGSGWWRRAVVIASAVPIAVFANVIRITVTGILHAAGQNKAAEMVFHDIAGLLMMVLAVVTVFLELHVLDRLIVDNPNSRSRTGPILFLGKKKPAESNVNLG